MYLVFLVTKMGTSSGADAKGSYINSLRNSALVPSTFAVLYIQMIQFRIKYLTCEYFFGLVANLLLFIHIPELVFCLWDLSAVQMGNAIVLKLV